MFKYELQRQRLFYGKILEDFEAQRYRLFENLKTKNAYTVRLEKNYLDFVGIFEPFDTMSQQMEVLFEIF